MRVSAPAHTSTPQEERVAVAGRSLAVLERAVKDAKAGRTVPAAAVIEEAAAARV